MLLEPAPIDPRPGRTRRQAVLAAVAAGGVLVAVVGVGLLGPNPVPAGLPAAAATSAPEAVTQPDAVASATTDGSTASGAAPVSSSAADDGAGPPARSRFGLDPTTVTAVLEAHARGYDPGTPVTVDGWLSIWPSGGSCLASATSSAPACSQEGILAADPGPTLRWDGRRAVEVDPWAPHLRPIFPAGMTLPPSAAAGNTPGSPPLAGVLPVREVIVIGHFGPTTTDACGLGFLECTQPFIVDGID